MHRVIALCARTRRAARDESGQTMAEYGLLLGIISIGLLLAVTTIGVTVNGFFMSVAPSL